MSRIVGPTRRCRISPAAASTLCDIVTTAKPQIDGGTVKALAVLNDTRSPALPNVPTAVEQGFDVKDYTWNAFFSSEGNAPGHRRQAQSCHGRGDEDAGDPRKLEAGALKLVSEDRTTPAYLDRFVQDEIAKWAVLIKASGISID
jgi:tripartite-type tricarboxylate transporter receptor subunit TctC